MQTIECAGSGVFRRQMLNTFACHAPAVEKKDKAVAFVLR